MATRSKVLLLYNETNPELYIYKSELEKSNLNFKPYFEIENVTPMDEYDQMGQRVASLGYEVKSLNVNDNLDVLLNALQEYKPDVVFNFVEIFHGQPKLEMNVAGLFDLYGVPYTGAPPIALATCQNKLLAKKILIANGIQTPAFEIFPVVKTLKVTHNLNYPLIVKPLFEDASVGIENASVVHDLASLRKRIKHVHNEFKQPALVEEFIEGRELNVSVLGDKETVVLPISEIDFSTMPDHLENIVSYQAKWDSLHEAYHKTIPICPAKLPKKLLAKIEKIALKAFSVLHLRDYARVDMRLRADGEVFVLEANPNPDLSEGAGFMRSAEAAGYPYEKALDKLIQLALARGKK